MSEDILANVAAKTKELEEQQLYAYTNFINYIINEEPFVYNILTDLKDGLTLIRFLRNLSGRDIPNSVEYPVKDIEKIQNLSAVIQFAKDDGIKILSSAEEILNGDRKGILSFMYQILNKYRLGNCPVKMIHFAKWIKSSLKIEDTNFDLKKELSEGKLLAKLLNHLQNGVVSLDSLNENHIENIQKCIDIGYSKLRIPKLVKADCIANNIVDDYCLYFYLTFFIMKETHFEDNEILNKIAEGLRERKIQVRTALKNRLSNSLKKMIECCKGAQTSYPNLDGPDVPEEAKTLMGMAGQLEMMLEEFEKITTPRGYDEMSFDLSNDPVLKELKEWEGKINITEEIVRKLLGLMNQKKRKTLSISKSKPVEKPKEEEKLVTPRMSEINEMKKLLEEKKREVEYLKEVKFATEEEKEKLHKENQNQKDEIEKIKIVLGECQRSYEVLKGEMKKQNEMGSEEIERLKELKTKLEEEQKAKQSKEEELERVQKEQQKEKKEREEEVNHLKNEIEEMKRTIEEEKMMKEKESEIKKQEIKNLKKEILVLGESKGDEVKKMKELMEEKSKEMKKMRETQELENKHLKEEIEKMRKEEIRKEEEKKKSADEILSMKQEIENLKKLLQEEKTKRESVENQVKEKDDLVKIKEQIVGEKQLKIDEKERIIQQLEVIVLESKKQYAELIIKFNDREMFFVENEADKRVLFNSLALAIKMALPTVTKIDNTMLYNECMNQKVPLKNWNIWLVNRLTKK